MDKLVVPVEECVEAVLLPGGLVDFAVQPRPRVSPMIFGRAGGDAECFRRLLDRHADEVAQFHQFRFLFVFNREFVERVVDGQELIIFGWRCQFNLRQVHALLVAAMAEGAPLPGAINQDAPHRFGGGAEKVRPAIPLLILVASESKPGFVYERGGLQCVPRSFICHPGRGEFTQFIVNKRQQFFRGLRIAMMGGLEDAGDVAHVRQLKATGFVGNRNPHGKITIR